ncbi:MAG: DUF3021 family protein [Bacilli bacterium]
MYKIFKKVTIGSLLSITIGFIVTLIMCKFLSNSQFTLPIEFINLFYSELMAFIIQSIIWASIGIIYSLCDYIWNNNWNIIKQSLLAASIHLITILFAAYLSKWMSWELSNILQFIVIFFIIFIIIWITNYFLDKKNINELNNKL